MLQTQTNKFQNIQNPLSLLIIFTIFRIFEVTISSFHCIITDLKERVGIKSGLYLTLSSTEGQKDLLLTRYHAR